MSQNSDTTTRPTLTLNLSPHTYFHSFQFIQTSKIKFQRQSVFLSVDVETFLSSSFKKAVPVFSFGHDFASQDYDSKMCGAF